ncbi:MAG: PEP-CTERM sorting domain-containing protein [Xanthobacteraceae bacterium]
MSKGVVARSATAAVCVSSILLFGLSAASAGEVPNGTQSSATAEASADHAPQFTDSHITIQNGIVTDNAVATDQGGGSGTGSTSFAGSTNTYSNVTATINGNHNSATTSSSANLATGILRSSITPSGTEFFGSPSGFTKAFIGDGVTFSNTSGHVVDLSLTFGINGSFAPTTSAGSDPKVDAFLQFYAPQVTSLSQAVGLSALAGGQVANIGNANGGDLDIHLQAFAQRTNPFFSVGTNGGASLPDSAVFGLSGNISNTSLVALLTTVLVIPDGVSSIDIGAGLFMNCNSAYFCDLSHTGILSFGALPDGLTYTSDSGVFLEGAAATSETPLPATWTMMLAGLTGFGALARRARRKAPAV